MSLPSIKWSLPVLLVGWGVGAYAAGMGPLLIYPAIWLGVVGLVFGLHLALNAVAPAVEAPDSAATES